MLVLQSVSRHRLSFRLLGRVGGRLGPRLEAVMLAFALLRHFSFMGSYRHLGNHYIMVEVAVDSDCACCLVGCALVLLNFPDGDHPAADLGHRPAMALLRGAQLRRDFPRVDGPLGYLDRRHLPWSISRYLFARHHLPFGWA